MINSSAPVQYPTRTPARSHTPSLSLIRSLIHSLTLTLSLSLTHTHTDTHSCSNTLLLSHTHSLTHAHAKLFFTHTHKLSLDLSLSLSLSLTHRHFKHTQTQFTRRQSRIVIFGSQLSLSNETALVFNCLKKTQCCLCCLCLLRVSVFVLFVSRWRERGNQKARHH